MAALSVRCPGCRKKLAAPKGAAGRTLKCPNCRGKVTVPNDSATTLVDEGAPDFSYLRNQPEADDDILVADDADDGESALGQSTARQPVSPTAATRVQPAAPPPVVYIPQPVAPPPADNPFTDLTEPDEKPRRKPADPAPEKTDPPSERRKRDPDPRPVTRSRSEQNTSGTPGWVWPVVVGLAVYAAAATGVGAWGWVKVLTTDPPAKSAR